MSSLALKTLAIGALALLLAVLVHGSFVRKSLNGELVIRADIEELKEKAPSLRVITLEEAMQRHQSGAATFIDARPRSFYRAGHIPGAVSFPVREYEKNHDLQPIAQWKSAKIVIYCSGKDCPDSNTLAAYLAKEGFLDIEIFEGGFPEWKDAGMSVESSP